MSIRSNPNNQYDPGLIVKEVSDFNGQFIRTTDVRSTVPGYYSHFSIQYDDKKQPTLIDYLFGLTPHITKITTISDVSSSLNNKYLSLRNAPDNSLFHIWFNVDGAGIDPAPANSTPIEIEIQENDSKEVIAMAVALIINTLHKKYFTASRNGDTVEIRTTSFAIVSDSIDVDTLFSITNTQATQKTVASVNLSYDVAGNPIFNGQVLYGYKFNVFSGKFENADSTNLSKRELITFVDDSSGDIIYIGEASPGSIESEPVWKIRRVDLTTSIIEILFADSNNNFDNVWNDRGTLTYG